MPVMTPLLSLAIVLYSINSVLLAVLAYVYGRTALSTRAKYPLGLFVFSTLLLLQSGEFRPRLRPGESDSGGERVPGICHVEAQGVGIIRPKVPIYLRTRGERESSGYQQDHGVLCGQVPCHAQRGRVIRGRRNPPAIDDGSERRQDRMCVRLACLRGWRRTTSARPLADVVCPQPDVPSVEPCRYQQSRM